VSRIGLIVGSGELPWQLEWSVTGSAETAFGSAAMAPELAGINGVEVVRLMRHGRPHRFAPHAINYRANIAALDALDVEAIIAVNTVGGISSKARTGALLLPDQLIDYTWGRESTFSPPDAVRHIDFSQPYDSALNAELKAAGESARSTLVNGGVMAVTQGPRLETAGEIKRLARDGCDVVGMTGMPEAALARECDIPFAALCLIVNPAAGVADDEAVDMDRLKETARLGMIDIGELLLAFFERRL
jgi:5'-methylthioinosine phosphorylase